MYNHEGGPTVKGCIFTNNIAGAEGGGIYNHHQGPTLTNCLINGNFATLNGGGIGGDNLYMGDLTMTNCTIVANEAGEQGGGMFEYDDSDLYLTNCIIWGNSAYEGPQMALTMAVNAFIRHCCFEGGKLDIFTELNSYANWGPGNTKADPRFADVLAGDYHLKSKAGRWDPNSKSWVKDTKTSPCVDAGDPNSNWNAELWPHGKQANAGAFGATHEASMSSSRLGNVADLDANGKVDHADIRLLTEKWLDRRAPLPEDLDRNGVVNSKDFAAFAKQWSSEQ